jgi:hypothetical protein
MDAIGHANRNPIIAPNSDSPKVPTTPKTTINAVFANDLPQSCIDAQSNGGGPLSYIAITHIVSIIANPMAKPAKNDPNRLALTTINVRLKNL